VDVAAALRAGRENRDFLRELDQQRAPTAVPVVREDAAQAPPAAAATPTPEPASTYQAVPAAPSPETRRPVQEVEDLDIPAFLRRSSR
jgi:hypothetical protein